MLFTSEVPQIFAVRQMFQKIGGELGLVWLSSFFKANSVDVNSKSMPDECANSSFASEVPAPTRKLDRFTSKLTTRFERMQSETSNAYYVISSIIVYTLSCPFYDLTKSLVWWSSYLVKRWRTCRQLWSTLTFHRGPFKRYWGFRFLHSVIQL